MAAGIAYDGETGDYYAACPDLDCGWTGPDRTYWQDAGDDAADHDHDDDEVI